MWARPATAGRQHPVQRRSGSGHPTSAMSAADLMAVLLARHLRYDWDNPGAPGNDHLIFSNGHASPLLYATFKAAGAISDEELVTGFRRFGSRLQGMAWLPSAPGPRWSPWTGRSATPPTPGSSPRPTRTGSSRCSSPNSSSSPRQWAWRSAGMCRSPPPSPRSSPAAYDFLRMAGISGANIKLCGSHAGVEIGPDGPSQMALEDLAALRAIHGSTVLYPSDATSAAALAAEMAATPGIMYLRTTRGAWPVLYQDGEAFPVGECKVLRASGRDQVTLIGAGVTVHQCLRAAGELATGGIAARVIDLYSVKPARPGNAG